MDEPVAPLSGDDEAAVVRAVEDNMAASLVYSAQRLGATLHDSDELLWTLTNTDALSYNTILRTRWPDEPTETLAARIAATLAPYHAASKAALWWRWPSSNPAALGDALVAYGLSHRGEGPGMSANLRDVPTPATLNLPSDLTVEEVGDLAHLREWVQVESLVYHGETSASEEEDDQEEEIAREERLGLGAQLPYRRWLARLAGKPVGTSAIFLGAGVVGLYGVTTLPEARGQGVGAAATVAALTAARDAGYHVATLLSSPMGFPVYTRLGFREVCRVQSYVWRPAT